MADEGATRPAAGSTGRQRKARVLLGERLRHLRGEKGVTVIALSEATLMSKSYIWDVERGRRVYTLDQLEEVARVLGVLVTDVLDGVWPYGDAEEPARADVSGPLR